MNSHAALYLAEARHAELRSTATRARAAATTSTPSWVDRIGAGVFRRQRQLIASTTRSALATSRASTTV
jgi:hypothetical protein